MFDNSHYRRALQVSKWPSRSAVIIALALVAFASLAALVVWSLTPPSRSDPDPQLPRAMADSGTKRVHLPISFEPNAGQADQAARYVAHVPGGVLLFSSGEVILDVATGGNTRAAASGRASDLAGTTAGAETDQDLNPSNQGYAHVHRSFVGGNRSAQIKSASPLPGGVNYFRGKDPQSWHSNIATFGTLAYSDLYPGVSLSYSGTDGRLEGTYTVAPGADPALIRWRYPGAAQPQLDSEGGLHVTFNEAGTGRGEALQITEQAPTAWQPVEGGKVLVGSHYVVEADGTIGFALGSYDRSLPLIIDPTITYSTYLGGFYGELARGVTTDSSGNMYVVGVTESTDFPLQNPVQPLFGGGDNDAFIAKLSADGQTLLYATYLGGGPGPEGTGGDSASFISVDPAGNMIVAGLTDSVDFPTTPGAYQTEFEGPDSLFMAKLDATGSQLIFSTYIGYILDDGGFAVDSAGNTYFTGYTYNRANRYAEVGKLNADGSNLYFDRLIGGEVPGPGDQNSDSAGQGLSLDSSGNVYVTGYTRAADFPVTAGAYRTSIERYEDGFIMKLNPENGATIYSTYIPGDISEYPDDIAADSAGNAYITGFTWSNDYPTTPNAFHTRCGDATCSFLTKLNPSGSALVFSTYLGGLDFSSGEDYGEAVRVSEAGNAYVDGYTSSPNFPVENPIQPTLRGDADAFLTKFNPDGTGVEYSTFLGGNGSEGAVGLHLDGEENVYLVGGTDSDDFPVVQPYQANNHGSNDAFLMRISEGSVTPTPVSTGTPPTATPTACAPGPSLWRTESPLPTGRDYATGAAAGGKLYIMGGWAYIPSPTYVPEVESYDPATSGWSTVSPIPVPSSRMSAASLDNKIYVVGGWGPSPYFETDFMQIYDATTDSWSQGAHLPVRLSSPAVAAYNGKIYIFGGSRGYPEGESNLVFEYDPEADTYTSKAPMPAAQDEIGAAAIGDRIYVMGGYQYIHYWYDPAADTWGTTANPPISTGFSNAGVFALNGELWVEGGYDNYNRRGYPPEQEVQIYNPVTNSWRYGPAFNTPRTRSRAGGVLDGRIYVATGADLGDDSQTITSVESATYLQCSTATITPTTVPATGTVVPTGTGLPSATASTTPVLTPPNETLTPTAVTLTPTGVPITPTTVPTTGTAVPTSTGLPSVVPSLTPCAIAFSDVMPSDYFYEAVTYLACHGVLSGYQDGTFRPYTNTTRGQLSKIVVLAQGWPLSTTGGPHFSDVSTSSPFYSYIETAYNRGIITGYADGTFRWGNNVTRGQLSKIVVGAKGWEINTTAGPHFTDVPSTDIFYPYIETAYNHSIISGYADGTFRPGNQATRGQISKIVYLAVTQLSSLH